MIANENLLDLLSKFELVNTILIIELGKKGLVICIYFDMNFINEVKNNYLDNFREAN